jgi:hypothetical protein
MNVPAPHYEIRFHRQDGRLSLVMLVPAANEADAKDQARRMLMGDLANANIWRAGTLVDSVYRQH